MSSGKKHTGYRKMIEVLIFSFFFSDCRLALGMAEIKGLIFELLLKLYSNRKIFISGLGGGGLCMETMESECVK